MSATLASDSTFRFGPTVDHTVGGIEVLLCVPEEVLRG
jgi:hypothetical protein